MRERLRPVFVEATAAAVAYSVVCVATMFWYAGIRSGPPDFASILLGVFGASFWAVVAVARIIGSLVDATADAEDCR